MLKLKKFVIKNKTYIICIFIIILSIISVITQSIDRKNSLSVNSNVINDSNEIAVYITGAVKNPGVYYLEEGSRLYNLLDICGGILENADIEKINLAQKLVDAEKIIIYEKSEKLDENIENEEENEKININEASEEELKTLTGIGESTAKKIIEYREKNRFIEIEDIINVDGVGTSKFEAIKNDICV